MSGLRLETFISKEKDFEINQYKVLSELREYLIDFRKKRLFPALTDLIKFNRILTAILKNKSQLDNSFPKEITGFDVKNKKIIYENTNKNSDGVDYLFDLIEWTIPKIIDAIEEGVALYEYVEKNIRIESVGIIPLNKEEGYFLVPDNQEAMLRIHRFECSLFNNGKEPYRALKTTLIDAIEQMSILSNPEWIKLDLIKQYFDLPNPATYNCITDLDFPFLETVFPIAKRKLMSYLAA
ncbi:MAG: hypothetical protein ACM3O3_03400 [Syntrophothermus sp.]